MRFWAFFYLSQHASFGVEDCEKGAGENVEFLCVTICFQKDFVFYAVFVWIQVKLLYGKAMSSNLFKSTSRDGEGEPR